MTGADKYRYYVSIGGTYRRVTLIRPITITSDLDQNALQRNHIPKTSEWKLHRSENPYVYDQLMLIIASPSTQTSKVQCKIDLYEDWSTLTGNVFTGYVPINNFKVNGDTGIIEFTPEDDSLMSWVKNYGKEKKSLSIDDTATSLYILDHSTSVDFFLPYHPDHDYNNCVIIDHSTIAANNLSIPEWTIGEQYYSYSDTTPNFLTKDGVWVYWNSKFYFCIQSHVGSADITPGIDVGWENYWMIAEDVDGYLNEVYQVRMQVSSFKIIPVTAGLPGSFIRGDGEYQGQWFRSTNWNDGATNCDVEYFCYPYASEIEDNALISSAGNKSLADVFEQLLDGSGLTFASDFFTEATNPVTGETSLVTNLFLSSKAYATGFRKIGNTYECNIDDLLAALCGYFNCRYKIDTSTSELIVEHWVWFENGGSYDGTPSIYTDLTDQSDYPLKYQTIFDHEGNKTDNEFIINAAPYEKEIFDHSESYDAENWITYENLMVKKGESITISPVITTDLIYAMNNHEDIDKNGILLLACDENNVVIREFVTSRTSAMINEVLQEDLDYPNGHLMYDNLIRTYWTYGRPFLSGKINDDVAATTFDSQRKDKIQRPITFPRLETGLFDTTKYITTNIGDGEVKAYDHRLDGDFITVELIYTLD